MVFHFSPRNHVPGTQDWLIYMGKDKYENEDLIKYMLPTDAWFHVDDLSSAHVYLRLPDGATLDDIPPDTLEDCAHLVKNNSIQGSKLPSVSVVYTMWANLRKTAGMDVGQVGFHDERAVRHVKVVLDARAKAEIVNRLEKTRREVLATPEDLAREKKAFESQRAAAAAAADRAARVAGKAAKADARRQADLQEYKSLMKEENMQSNRELAAKYSSVEEYEDDFM